MEDKLNVLAAKIEKEMLEYMIQFSKGHLDTPERVMEIHGKSSIETKVIPGKKYTKIDVGHSGKYMVDEEGRIFGIKAYGVIHRGHQYGTLDTINDFYWGGYTATRRA